jgi:hypothetical protein
LAVLVRETRTTPFKDGSDEAPFHVPHLAVLVRETRTTPFKDESDEAPLDFKQ